MSTSDRESILHKIAHAERQIESLNQQREKVEATLRSLRERLTLYDDENPRQPTTPATGVTLALAARGSRNRSTKRSE